MYNEVIVVEGTNDKAKILEIYPDAFVVITNGSEISEKTLVMLENLAKNHTLVLLLDPDYPGERIRSIISNRISNCKQAFVPKKEAICERKHKVGVEHCTHEVIKNALDKALSKSFNESNITINDCYRLGLNGKKDSKNIRKYLSDVLCLGEPNFKTLYKRLCFIGAKTEDIERILNEKDWNN